MQIVRYRSKASGPLLDRLDIHVEVPAVPYRELVAREAGEASEPIRARVVAARSKQARRFADGGMYVNVGMSAKDVRRYCAVDSEGARLMEKAINQLRLSRVPIPGFSRLAGTIADLESSEAIRTAHLSEAIQYRGCPYNTV